MIAEAMLNRVQDYFRHKVFSFYPHWNVHSQIPIERLAEECLIGHFSRYWLGYDRDQQGQTEPYCPMPSPW
jgi:hypothetical protein